MPSHFRAAMSRAVLASALEAYVDRDWPPMRHVERGLARLDPAAAERVAHRIAAAGARFEAPAEPARRAALRRLFSFLAQVEVIAIEVPLSALPSARADLEPLLVRQLEDEVFHALVFAVLARGLGGLDRPVPEAETLLDQIRQQADPRTSAVLLNAIAEGWIENLFEHAATWNVADAVFRVVLADEARHVQEAVDHAAQVDARAVEPAVRAFEAELFKLAQHPRVVLPILAVAGEGHFRRLSASFVRVHERALASVGLAPDPAVVELGKLVDETGLAPWLEAARPEPVEPETQWRRTALQLWDTPRDPVMHGWFDARVDHVPRRLLTAVLVAVVGQVWREYPRINRYAWGGRLWEPQGVNVGVRVALGDSNEALSTIVIPNADERSVQDIMRILQAGVARMSEVETRVGDLPVDPEAEALATILRDEELMGMVPPESVACPVTVSNVGRAGLQAGFGSMPGALGQSVEIVLGRVEKRPVWTGLRYAPRDTVTVGAGADHRVFDGNHCAEAIRRIKELLGPQGVKAVLARPDTLPADEDVEARMMQGIGISAEQGRVMLSCKVPFWLGWLCWMFKK